MKLPLHLSNAIYQHCLLSYLESMLQIKTLPEGCVISKTKCLTFLHMLDIDQNTCFVRLIRQYLNIDLKLHILSEFFLVIKPKEIYRDTFVQVQRVQRRHFS